MRFFSPRTAFPLLFLFVAVPLARADVTLLLGEPYGRFGSFSPTGHMALYFHSLCADTPVSLRHCEDGETGTVIARYSGIAKKDWVAIPLVPFLYAVESSADVPAAANRGEVAALRDAYRRDRLQSFLPDGEGGRPPGGRWTQLVGATYDRRILAFTVRTTAEQDEFVMWTLNGRPNRERFNFFFENCADFALDVMNLYFPGVFKKSIIADLGLTTPKQIAKTLVRYADEHPRVELETFVIAQIPGNQSPSRQPKGVLEGLLTTKKYLMPLFLAQPWLPAGMAAGYVAKGRFVFERDGPIVAPGQLESSAVAATAAGVAQRAAAETVSIARR